MVGSCADAHAARAASGSRASGAAESAEARAHVLARPPPRGCAALLPLLPPACEALPLRVKITMSHIHRGTHDRRHADALCTHTHRARPAPGAGRSGAGDTHTALSTRETTARHTRQVSAHDQPRHQLSRDARGALAGPGMCTHLAHRSAVPAHQWTVSRSVALSGHTSSSLGSASHSCPRLRSPSQLAIWWRSSLVRLETVTPRRPSWRTR